MFLPQDNKIDVVRLSRVFNNTVATYKYYWFISIIDSVCEKHCNQFDFDEIIANMIAEAWYPIHYFKLSFGSSDSLFQIIIEIQSILSIPVDEDKKVIKQVILEQKGRPEIRRHLKKLSQYVPYRFLSPWIPSVDNSELAFESIRRFGHCLYSIQDRLIVISDAWIDYLQTNASVLKDFCFWNLANFIQKRNPNVPDVPSKLVKPLTRTSLSSQHGFWNRYLESVGSIKCIYTGVELVKGSYDLDHFVPWSFCAHDLLWNLIPANSSVNSSKSNNLPSLDRYLKPMAELQQKAFAFDLNNRPNDKLLEDYLVFRCSLQELKDMPLENFTDLLFKQFTPMVQTASNMGFAYWKEQ